jgi:hypothetical protein
VLLASGSDDHTARVWDPAAAKAVLTLPRRSPTRCLAAAGPTLAIGDDEWLTVVDFDSSAS